MHSDTVKTSYGMLAVYMWPQITYSLETYYIPVENTITSIAEATLNINPREINTHSALAFTSQ